MISFVVLAEKPADFSQSYTVKKFSIWAYGAARRNDRFSVIVFAKFCLYSNKFFELPLFVEHTRVKVCSPFLPGT